MTNLSLGVLFLFFFTFIRLSFKNRSICLSSRPRIWKWLGIKPFKERGVPERQNELGGEIVCSLEKKGRANRAEWGKRQRSRAELKCNFLRFKLSTHANEAHISAIMMTKWSSEDEAALRVFICSSFINKRTRFLVRRWILVCCFRSPGRHATSNTLGTTKRCFYALWCVLTQAVFDT